MTDETQQTEDQTNEDLAPENNTEAEVGDGQDARNSGSDEDDDDDDDGEDLRVNAGQIEKGGDAGRQHRQRRKERQRLARERTQAEIAALRAENEEIKKYLQSLGHQVQTTQVQTLDQKLGYAQQHLKIAEQQIEDATNRGDGAALRAAMAYRDNARETIANLRNQRAQLPEPRQPENKPEAERQQVPPATRLAQEWAAANPWFDYNGASPQIEATKRAERALMQEGYDPNQRGFWKELSKRVSTAMRTSDTTTKPKGGPPVAGAGSGKAGGTEYALSAERIQAIKDAGRWDDPKERAAMINAYREYDKQNTAR